MADKIIIDIDEELKKQSKKTKWKRRKENIERFVRDNATPIIVIGLPVLGTVIKTAVRSIGRTHVALVESRNKDRMFWDPSLGSWWELKRKLSSNERLEVERRRRNGEAIGQILSKMKVLK